MTYFMYRKRFLFNKNKTNRAINALKRGQNVVLFLQKYGASRKHPIFLK